MKERSTFLDKLINDYNYRLAYIKAKVGVNIPSQIKAMRRRRDNLSQEALAKEAGKRQSQISSMERPGVTSFTVETLIRLAAAFKVGLIVRFVPFSEMLKWENNYSQDYFNVTPIDHDIEFVNPEIRGELSLAASMGAGTSPAVASIYDFPVRGASLKEAEEQLAAISSPAPEMAGMAGAATQALP